MRKILLTAMIALFLLAAVATAAEREYKLGVATPEGNHATIGMQKFSQLLTEKTGGRIASHVYTGGQLASGERELIEGLQFGTVDVAVASTGMMSTYDDRFIIFSLPYLFRDEANVYKTVASPIGDEFRRILEEDAGIVILGWFMSGVHTITTNRPINAFADLKGLKLRCMENPIITAAWRAFNAVPTPMSLGEVFTALQQGTVDGQDNGTANSYANKYYEVQKYLCMTEHMIVPQVFVMSKDKYDAIPADLRPAFDAAVEEAVAYQRAVYAEFNQAAVDNMKAKGMEVTYPDKAPFIEASEPIRNDFIKKMGAQMAQWVEDIKTKY